MTAIEATVSYAIRSDVVALEGMRWPTYLAILEETHERRASRIAYHDGRIEIMSPGRNHERVKTLLGRLLEAASVELGLGISPEGSVTLRREDAEAGVEADETYYVAHAEAMRAADRIDLSAHPAPDLAIEVAVSRDSAWKRATYAAIGVAELWQIRPETMEVRVRVLVEGEYVERAESACLPAIPVGALGSFLRRLGEDQDQVVRDFLALLRG